MINKRQITQAKNKDLTMKYDINWLSKQPKKQKYLYFWGHTPNKDGSMSSACFSQWWENSPFEVDGIRYATAEHFMMAQKAKLFNDEDIFQQIVNSTHPNKAKQLGRKVANFDDNVWKKHRFDIVVAGNMAKFEQDKRLKQYLLNTGKRVLVEASPYDKIWGVGLARDNEMIANPLRWKGLNLLGFALMVVRDELKS